VLCFQQGTGLAADLNQNAGMFQIETSGYASARLLHGNHGGNTRSLAATALLRSKLKFDQDMLSLQLRPLLTRTRNNGTSAASATVDEGYWEHRLSAGSFAFLGRRKIVNGVAFGRNPSNFFNQGKPEDRTLTDADRRAEMEGDDMLGWSYFGHSYSIQTLFATPAENSKRTRAMLQADGNLNSISTDFSFILYYADRPSLGMNLSSLLGDNATLYAETAFHKGRDRRTPVLSENGTMLDAREDESRWISNIVIGGQYTTDSGANFAAEYWRNDNGFSGKEYAGIVNTLASGQGNPRLAGSLLSAPGLRKNSLFFRMADIPLSEALKGEAVWIRNMDDSSSFLRGAVNWDIGNTDSFRLGFEKLVGAERSEYGSSNLDWRAFFIYKKYF